MSNFFKRFFEAIANLFKSKKEKPKPLPVPEPVEPEPVEPTPVEPEPVDPVDDNPDDDNEDPEKPDDGGDYTVYPEDEEKLYFPKAIRSEHKLRTRGYYKQRYPQGAIVHFTAGRGRNKEEGGKKNADTHLEMGKRSISSAEDKGSYAYFIIDRSGNVHQNFPLDRWGYHGGESAWEGLSGSVSDELVGIEIQNAGRLRDYYQNSSDGTKYDCPEGKLAAWYTRPNSGDLFFDKETECRYSENNDNIQKGWYHAYSPEQEEALENLLIWLKRNNPDVFEFKYVLGHDEVAGKKGIGRNRKNDPGAALSMTMTEFREKIEKEYNERYSGNPAPTPEPTPEPPQDGEVTFEDMIKAYKSYNIEYPVLREITVAQWILETGHGRSDLFKKFKNCGGVKWRGDLGVEEAYEVQYEAHDGLEGYAGFKTFEGFFKYYWNFLERSYYEGWREEVKRSPEAFMGHIVRAGYCPDPGYLDKVLKLMPEAKKLLS